MPCCLFHAKVFFVDVFVVETWNSMKFTCSMEDSHLHILFGACSLQTTDTHQHRLSYADRLEFSRARMRIESFQLQKKKYFHPFIGMCWRKYFYFRSTEAYKWLFWLLFYVHGIENCENGKCLELQYNVYNAVRYWLWDIFIQGLYEIPDNSQSPTPIGMQ